MAVKNSPGLSASLPGVDSAPAEYKKTVNLPIAACRVAGQVEMHAVLVNGRYDDAVHAELECRKLARRFGQMLTAEAEWTRVALHTDPGRWAEAVGAWDELGSPWPTAYTRWRLAEALLERGAPREEAAVPLRQAWASAGALGARPLQPRPSRWPAAPGSRWRRSRRPQARPRPPQRSRRHLRTSWA